MGGEAATADTTLSHGLVPGDRVRIVGEDGPDLCYVGTNEAGDAVLSYGGSIVREVALAELGKVGEE
jgi:hypothetical protein